MQLPLPETITVSFAMFAWGLGLLIAALGSFLATLKSYWELNRKIDDICLEIGEMKKRNRHADEETEAVKKEQSEQKTTVSVMAAQIDGMNKTIDRMDGGIAEILREMRRNPS